MKSYAFLFWACAVIWLGIASFSLLLLGRIRAADRRLDRLEQELDRR